MRKNTLVKAFALLSLLLTIFSPVTGQIHLKSGVVDLEDFQSISDPSNINFENFDGKMGFFAIIHFEEIPSQEFTVWNSQYFALKKYLPNNAYYTWVSRDCPFQELQALGMRIFEIQNTWKIDPIVLEDNDNHWFINKELLDLSIHYLSTSAVEKLVELGATVLENDNLTQSVSIRIRKKDLPQISSLNSVYWIEPISPEVETNNLVERTSHRVPYVEAGSGVYNLSGKGVAVGEWDGSGADLHIDYDFRHTQMEAFTNNGNGRHATHVAGTVLGAGIIDPNAKGMAPEALLYSYNFGGNIPREMDTAANNFDLRLTQNSYSYGSSSDPCSRRGTYDGTSSALDIVSNRYPHLLHVFAAGNSRSSNCKSGGYGTVHSGFQAAKNSIDVAAVTYTDGNSWFHCYGPTRDGRLKPEISAVGVNVYSTFPNNTYRGGYNGTSMACPGVSGTAALIHELYENKFSKFMPAHLLKGVLCNGADELGRPGPDYQYGFGRINARRSADIVENEHFILDDVANGATFEDTIFISDFPLEFKVTLCWNDIEASSSAGSALVNDLDLEVYDSAGNKYLPWTLDPVLYTANATRRRDSLNNIEQVTIASPSSGYFIVRVKGTRITNGRQDFSLNWLSQDTAIYVIYPNGGEKWLTPSSAANAQTLRWDSYGLSGNSKVEFSADNGNTWSTLANSVTATRNYHIWNNASTTLQTSNALIRVTTGGQSDQSNAVFNIGTYGPTPAAIACDSQLHLTWGAVANATSYNVYLLDSGQMKMVGNTSNRFFTIRGLANGVDHWVSISSVGANGGEGLRSRAVRFRTNSFRTPVKLIKDLKDIRYCDGTSNVSLNVSDNGAGVRYSWEYSTNQGQTWKHVSNNSSTFTIGTVRLADNENLYRAKLTNTTCLDTLRSATSELLVDRPLYYSIKPQNPTVCIGQDLTLNPVFSSVNEPDYGWYWRRRTNDPWKNLNSPSLNLDLKSINASGEGFYSIVLSNSCASSVKRATTYLTVRPELTLSIPGDHPVCVGQGIPLVAKASGGKSDSYQYSWSSNEGSYTTDSIFVFPTKDITWTAKVFDNCSKDTVRKQVKLTMRPELKADLGRDITICQGETANLIALASGGDQKNLTYTWSDIGVSSASRQVSPRQTTAYRVTISDGCTKFDAFDELTVIVRDPLQVEILSSAEQPCFDQEIVLTAVAKGGLSNAYSFRWENGSTNQVRKVRMRSDWQYRVELEDGCSDLIGRDTLHLTVRQPLQAIIKGMDTACHGQIIEYTAEVTGGDSGGYKYFWDGVEGNKTMPFAPYLTNPLRLRVEDGCTPKTTSAAKTIAVREQLNAGLTLGEIIICKGESIGIGFKALGGDENNYDITWSNGSKQESQIVQPTETTTYSFVLSDGCSVPEVNGEIEVQVRPGLSLDLGNDIQKCAEDSSVFRLNGNGGLANSYKYFLDGELLTGNEFWINNFATKMYIVRLEDACTVEPAIDTLNVRVTPLEATNFNLLSRTGKTATFNSPASPNNVLWTFGDGFSSANTAQFVDHTFPDFGNYIVCKTESDNIGCSKTFCMDLDFYDPETASNIDAIIYPNPTSGYVLISTSLISGDYHIELIDASGKVLIDEFGNNDSADKFELDLRSFSSGVYLLRTTFNGEVSSFKLIKSD